MPQLIPPPVERTPPASGPGALDVRRDPGRGHPVLASMALRARGDERMSCRSPTESHRPPPRAQGLPLRAPVHHAAGLREHREHQAPVRAAPAGHGAGLARRADHRHRPRPGAVRRLRRGPRGLSEAGRRGRAWGTPASCWAWRSRGWRATRPTGTGCWRSARSTDTLILDEDGIYDPAHFNDRLLLGPQGDHERGGAPRAARPPARRHPQQGAPRRAALSPAGGLGL